MGKRKRDRSKQSKSKFQLWLEFIPFLALCGTIRLLPMRLAYSISRILFRILYRFDWYHRRRAQAHLMHAKVAKNNAEADHIGLKSFQNFGMLLSEVVKLDQCFSIEKLRIIGDKHSRQMAFDQAAKRNVIVVTAHYGNWELAGTYWAKKSGKALVSVMRPFNNALIGRYILRNRASSIHTTVEKKGCMRSLLAALRHDKSIAILADQHASSKEGVETSFFGQPCRTHFSPALLHLKTGVPIIPMICRRIDTSFNFEFVLGKAIEYKATGNKDYDIQTVTQLYTSALEQLIGEQPEQWLWVHRRWLNLNRGKKQKKPTINSKPIHCGSKAKVANL